MARIYRNCLRCGNEFYILQCQLDKSNTSGKFCCRKCYNEYQKTLTGDKNNHFTRVKVNCPTCGKEFLALPSKIKMYKNTFCSVKCRSEYHVNYIGGDKNCNWKGGTSRLRGNFDEVKRKHFEGVQFCAICGTTKNIHIHHIIPFRLTQDNSLDNLIPLCNSHHKSVESVTLKFIELFDIADLDTAKKYINYTLRSRQQVTMTNIRRLYDEKRICNA